MARNFWEDDEITAEEIAEEQEEEAAPEPSLEDDILEDDILEEVLEEESDSEEPDVMSNARLRLEQGRLYELLMDHNLFEGVQADSRAVKNVEKEFKAFIKERLEILLGMKQERIKKDSSAPSPFTDTEVSLLKGLVGKVIEKQGLQQEASPKPASPAPKLALKPLRLPTPTTPQKAVSQSKPKVKAQPQKPVRKPKPEPQAEPTPLDKHPSEMTTEELIQRAKLTSNRYVKTKPIRPTKMPSADQLVMHYATRQEVSPAMGADGVSLPMTNVLNALGAARSVEDVGYPGDEL